MKIYFGIIMGYIRLHSSPNIFFLFSFSLLYYAFPLDVYSFFGQYCLLTYLSIYYNKLETE